MINKKNIEKNNITNITPKKEIIFIGENNGEIKYPSEKIFSIILISPSVVPIFLYMMFLIISLFQGSFSYDAIIGKPLLIFISFFLLSILFYLPSTLIISIFILAAHFRRNLKSLIALLISTFVIAYLWTLIIRKIISLKLDFFIPFLKEYELNKFLTTFPYVHFGNDVILYFYILLSSFFIYSFFPKSSKVVINYK